MIGVKTVGHATLIAYDERPVLATDPWLGGDGAFFGSWQLSHEIPPAELAELRACPSLWISHAHPDHLHWPSLEHLRAARVLVPDHYGGRMAAELRSRGFRVGVLPDRRWVTLSPRIRACCVADHMQNAALLLDVNGRLFVDANDAAVRGWSAALRTLVRAYPRSYLLKLAPTGHLGVLNVRHPDGRLLALDHAAPDRAGAELAAHADALGVSHVIPFSSFHQLQRSDSAWANAYNVPLPAFGATFASTTGATLLPAFIAVDCDRDEVRALDPRPLVPVPRSPADFGDHWNEPLERDERAAAADYFGAHDGLRARVGFVVLQVGGHEQRLELDRARATGIGIRAPRHSLVTAIREARLDELLLGHFAEVTLHGLAGVSPALVPTVTRYGDYGGVRRAADVAAYLAEYERRAAVAIVAAALAEPVSV